MASTPAPPPIETVRLNKLERPKTTFFYQRIDVDEEEPDQYPEMSGDMSVARRTGPRIEAFSEKEAASLKPDQWRQLGVSDGKAYYAVIQETITTHGQTMPIGVAREALQKAFDAELAVAKKNKKARGKVKPFVSHKHIGAVSSDVKDGVESLIQTGYMRQTDTKEE